MNNPAPATCSNCDAALDGPDTVHPDDCDFRWHCPDCGAALNEAHLDGCDVARCALTGHQRLMHEIQRDGARDVGEPIPAEYDHDCGHDLWFGFWPGIEDCRRLNLWCVGPPWTPCDPGTEGATEDLNRLPVEGVWNPEAFRWEPRQGAGT